MKQKVCILLLLCVAVLLCGIATAQDFSIFAKQKVVVADVIDRNDRQLTDGVKQVIRQGIVDACTNSKDYEVYEVDVEELKKHAMTNGQEPSFSSICKQIGQKADYIIFTSVKTTSSDLRAHDVKLILSASLFRISTASEVLSDIAIAEASSSSIISATTQLVSKLFGIEIEAKSQGQSPKPVPTIETPRPQVGNTQTPVSTSATSVSDEDNYRLASSYAREKEHEKAFEIFLELAQKGHLKSCHRLYYYYRDGKGGAEQDIEEALHWCRIAADKGLSAAQHSMGVHHYKMQEYEEAIKWYLKAAEQGYSMAQNNLGNCYRKGLGTEKDYKTAVYWYQRAADRGSRAALYNLGQCYENGLGVSRNFDKSRDYYRQAALKGHKGAMKKLEE